MNITTSLQNYIFVFAIILHHYQEVVVDAVKLPSFNDIISMTNEKKEDTTTTTTTTAAAVATEEGLSWRNLSVQKRNGQVILRPSNGFVSNGSVMAVIGPSGAGKSSFLGALSGTTLKASNLDVTGEVWVDKNDTVTGERQAVSLSIE